MRRQQPQSNLAPYLVVLLAKLSLQPVLFTLLLQINSLRSAKGEGGWRWFTQKNVIARVSFAPWREREGCEKLLIELRRLKSESRVEIISKWLRSSVIINQIKWGNILGLCVFVFKFCLITALLIAVLSVWFWVKLDFIKFSLALIWFLVDNIYIFNCFTGRFCFL